MRLRFLAAVPFLLFPLSALAHGMSEHDQQWMLNAGNGDYFLLGAKHMLTGYDHLLFLFAVLFFLTRFSDILKFITAFTLGHCITLIFATLLRVQVDYFLIDALIACTVMYKGFDNLDGFRHYFGIKSPNLLGMVFCFGLIHGLGLSARMQQLPLKEDGLVLRILSFNLGVEAGQVIALSVMILLLAGWRRRPSFAVFGKAANAALIFAGFMLFLMQMHSYLHVHYADEFPINEKLHKHVHEDMEEEAAREKLMKLYNKQPAAKPGN